MRAFAPGEWHTPVSRGLMEASRDLVILVGPEGRVLDTNERLLAAVGAYREAVVGSAFEGLFEDEATAREAQRATLRDGATKEASLSLRRAGRRGAAARFSLRRLEKGVGVLVIGPDPAGQERQEQTAEAEREALARNERLSALGTLVAGVAHEINNPLTYIQGNLELMLMDVEDARQAVASGATGALPSLADMERALRTALTGTDRIASITRSLRAVARPRTTPMERVDLNDVIRNVGVIAEARVADQTTLEIRPHPRVVPISGSTAEIHQVVLNLLFNALDAVAQTPAGRVRVSTAAEGAWTEIRVEDNGPGIPRSLRPKLFNPFFTTKPQGTGLGLSISHSIVREHGGDITVVSEPGFGAVFVVHLPLARD